MNKLQKVFVIGYGVAIIFGISYAVSFLTGISYWILVLAIAITLAILGSAVGVLFLGAWIYGYLEKFNKEKNHD